MAEMIDIYNANLAKLGQMDRVEAHLKGIWHVTFHLWIVLSEPPGFVVYQLRSPTAKNWPNLLDISAAGHLLAGEPVSAGLREAKEELGVEIPFADIKSLGFRVEVADQDNGQLNREHQAVHMVKLPLSLQDFSPDPTEVYGVVKVPVSDGLRLHCGDTAELTCDARVYAPGNRIWHDTTEAVTATRFLPRLQPYYRTVHIMAERLLEGRSTLSI